MSINWIKVTQIHNIQFLQLVSKLMLIAYLLPK